MKKYQKNLLNSLILFLLFTPQKTWAENQPGNCWDDFYDPPAKTTQIVRIDHLGIEVTIPSNYEIPLNRKYGNIIIIGSDQAKTWLMLADNGVKPEGSICYKTIEQYARRSEVSFAEQLMNVAQAEGLQTENYSTETRTAYLLHLPGASRAMMIILTPDRNHILILSAYCSDCPVPVSKLIDLVNQIKFIEN